MNVTAPYNTSNIVGPCPKAADVLFVVDKTYNMNYNYFQSYLIGVLDTIVEGLFIDEGRTRVAVITFSDAPTIEFYFGNFSKTLDVLNAINKISYGGYEADLAGALELARTQIFVAANGARVSPTVTWVTVIITDNPSENQTSTVLEAEMLRNAGVGIITVGVGTYLDLYELAAVATYPAANNSFWVSSSRNLPSLAPNIVSIICSVVGTCSIASGSPACNGCVEELLNHIQCTCSAGQTGPYCAGTCMNGADVVFAMVTSLGWQFTEAMEKFMAEIIESLDLSSSPTDTSGSRVGLVTYDNTATVQFQLNSYLGNDAGLLQATVVDSTVGGQNLAAAINVATNQMFTVANGARPNVPNYLIILMDGQSTNETATWEAAIAARAAGIYIAVVSISPVFDTVELSGIASYPIDYNIFTGYNTSALNSQWAAQISNDICGNTNYCANGPCLNGANCSNILGGYNCAPCPLAFTGYNCERDCSGVIDIVFVLNAGGATHLERWNYVLTFVIGVVLSLDVDPTRTRVGVIYYGSSAYVGLYLNQFTDRQDVIQAVQQLPYLGGQTNTAAALTLLSTMYSTQNGGRVNVPHYAILVTNQDSTVDQNMTIQAAVTARNDGIFIFTIGVEQAITTSLELQSISSFPRNFSMLWVSSFANLPSQSLPVIADLCQNVNYCSPNPCLNGGTCQNAIGQFICTCPTGYSGATCNRYCNAILDVVFIIDNSGSVEAMYLTAVAFARQVSLGLDVNNGLVRIGAVAFSTNLVGQFYLNSNIDITDVFNSFDFYDAFSTTNTQEALLDALNSQFSTANGNRPNVPDVAIIITDGYSNVDQTNTIPAANLLKAQGVTNYVVAEGPSPNLPEIDGLASGLSFILNLPIGQNSTTADDLLNLLCQSHLCQSATGMC